jgi:hypothetical protein
MRILPSEAQGSSSVLRRPARLGAIAAALCCAILAGAEAAEPAADLYTATVFVTGQGGETRGPGVARALAAVLVKVSGDPRLAHDPAAAGIAADTPALVAGFTYRDRMEGIPVHDEQGSRDRPYDLTVRFDEAAIDATLAALGRVPWTGPRPEILTVVAVENGDTRFILAADGARGRDMREAVAAAGEQYGMPVMLPAEAAFAAAGIAEAGFAAIDPTTLDAFARTSGADVALAGTLAWSDAALGWDAEWRIRVDGRPYRWSVHRVSFDDAFRSAIGGAAQILSGHGAPD